MLSGTLGAIPLRVSRARALSPPPLSLPRSLFVPLSSREAEDVSHSYIPASKSFRVSGATVKNIQNQLCPRPRCGAFAKGDESGIYIRTVGSQLSVQLLRFIYRSARGGPLRLFLMDRLTDFFVSCRRARKYEGGCDELS